MLNRFFCFRLHTAAVVIGWLGAILSFLTVVVFGFCLGYLDYIVKELIKNVENDTDEADLRKLLTIVFVAYLVTNAINLVASTLLVLGAIKERHLLLVPWLVNSGLALVFNVIYCIFVLIAATNVAASSAIGFVISAAISMALHSYLWLAIYSLFKNIQSNTDQQQQQQPLRPAGATYPSYTKI